MTRIIPLDADNSSNRAAIGGNSQPGPLGAYSNKRANPLSFEDVAAAVSYDPKTGIFYAKAGARRGQKVGRSTGAGYIEIDVRRRSVLAHRAAWLLVHGAWPAGYIDHIDRDKTNNAISNLREATRSQNAQNANRRGYSRQSSGSGFLARIKANGRLICLGTYKTEAEARSAYIEASRKYFGEFSAFCDRGHK